MLAHSAEPLNTDLEQLYESWRETDIPTSPNTIFFTNQTPTVLRGERSCLRSQNLLVEPHCPRFPLILYASYMASQSYRASPSSTPQEWQSFLIHLHIHLTPITRPETQKQLNKLGMGTGREKLEACKEKIQTMRQKRDYKFEISTNKMPWGFRRQWLMD